jgi:hypothetical protein
MKDYLEALRRAEAPKNLGGNEICLWIRRSLLVLSRQQIVVKLPGNPDGLRLPCGIPLRGPTEGGIPQGESAVNYIFFVSFACPVECIILFHWGVLRG